MKRYLLTTIIILMCVNNCKHTKINQESSEIERLKVAYIFLLNEIQGKNYSLIASENDKNLDIIRNIIDINNFNIEIEKYGNLEKRSDLCHYSKSTKRLVVIIDITRRNSTKYYVSYYIGPEGGASKEIEIIKRKGNWIIANDDQKWEIK